MLIYHLDAKITENRQSNMLKLCAKVSRGYARFHDSESRLSSARAVEEGGARCSTRSGARRSKNLTPTIQFHASSPLTFVTKSCLIAGSSCLPRFVILLVTWHREVIKLYGYLPIENAYRSLLQPACYEFPVVSDQ